MSRKYKFHNESGAYFISFATVYWLDVFTRQVYFNVLEESIDYCRAEKGMEVFAPASASVPLVTVRVKR
jgi:putative transposase